MLSDIVDAEVIENMTPAEAKKITQDIDLKLEIVARNWEEVLPLIRTAIDRSAHIALGYPSAGAYLSDKFGGYLGRLSINVRQDVVRELTDAGLSSRALASILSVSQPQVIRDRATSDAPAPQSAGDTPRITSDRTYEYEGDAVPAIMADATEEQFETALDRARTADDMSQERVVEELEGGGDAARVTGNDNKSYPASRRQGQAPERKQRRRPLPDAFRDLVYQIEKRVESLQRLVDDDRFVSNRAALLDEFGRRLDSIDADIFEITEALSRPKAPGPEEGE